MRRSMPATALATAVIIVLSLFIVGPAAASVESGAPPAVEPAPVADTPGPLVRLTSMRGPGDGRHVLRWKAVDRSEQGLDHQIVYWRHRSANGKPRAEQSVRVGPRVRRWSRAVDTRGGTTCARVEVVDKAGERTTVFRPLCVSSLRDASRLAVTGADGTFKMLRGKRFSGDSAVLLRPGARLILRGTRSTEVRYYGRVRAARQDSYLTAGGEAHPLSADDRSRWATPGYLATSWQRRLVLKVHRGAVVVDDIGAVVTRRGAQPRCCNARYAVRDPRVQLGR